MVKSHDVGKYERDRLVVIGSDSVDTFARACESLLGLYEAKDFG